MKSKEQPNRSIEPSLEELSGEYGLEIVETVSDHELDTDSVASLPVEWARTNCLLPVKIDGVPCVLTCDPSAVDQQEHLSLLTGNHLKPVLASRELILESIERCYYSKNDSPTDFIQDLETESDQIGAINRADDLLQVAEKAPVTQLINLILLDALKKRASDIHFEPSEAQLRVRYRIDGILYEQTSPPKHMVDPLVSRLKVMSNMDIAEKRLPQDGMAKVRVGEREFDIRISTIPVPEGERVVLRLLDKESTLLPLTSLGMSNECLESFDKLVSEPHGMIVVSGPTGSGKTTTLYAALSGMDSSTKNILTIEDPVEYQLDNIAQIQVKRKIGLTFSLGLRHILRQDPDIVLVGETRDSETASIGIRAALTGHLVFTTLHTNDAAGAIVRLIDMGVEPYLLASCIRGVLAQRLVRKLCPLCRKEVSLSVADAAKLNIPAKDVQERSVWEPVGCSKCIQGYMGRIGLFELMVIDQKLCDRIRSGNCTPSEIRSAATAVNMQTLLQDGISKVFSGKTSVSEILSVASI